MKSGIVSRRDPFLMDPLDLVDPNFIFDYESSFKDDTFHNSLVQVDPLLELINCNDSQLENIILDSNFCADNGENSWETDFDLDEIFRDKEQTPEIEAQTQAELELLKQEIDLSCSYNESDIANYEEVYADESINIPEIINEAKTTDIDDENDDTKSMHSFCSETSPQTLNENTLKRKIDDTKETGSHAPKRRKTSRRNKRVQDERVKNQNKVAAMKYRKKKRYEKDGLEEFLEIEERKNTKLKAEVDELKVNIDVLKELLGKYLAPNQLKLESKK